MIALLLAPITFLGSFVYGVTGFGAGLFTIPLASHLFELPFVLAVFALLDAVNAVRVLAAQPRAVVREEALRLIPSCVVGVAVGVALLVVLPGWTLMLGLGLFVLAHSTYSLLAPDGLAHVSLRWAYPAGLLGGVTSAMFGAGGPPFAVYLSLRPHDKHQMRATLAVTSMVSIGTRIAAFGLAGLLASSTVWLTALALMPVALLALAAAARVHARLSARATLRVIRILLWLSGASLVVRALVTLAQ
ncbi:MAG: sulfite exporter TauE/SafE family protein [Ectothiorhodospiraceae bacterium]|nr:sulfite exporter TauE/SafE family protein [Ectothiorhodospiraceae bacterium]